MLICKTAFIARIGGSRRLVAKGTLLDPSDPAVAGHEHLFRDLAGDQPAEVEKPKPATKRRSKSTAKAADAATPEAAAKP